MCDENQYSEAFEGAKMYICLEMSTISEEKSTLYIFKISTFAHRKLYRFTNLRIWHFLMTV